VSLSSTRRGEDRNINLQKEGGPLRDAHGRRHYLVHCDATGDQFEVVGTGLPRGCRRIGYASRKGSEPRFAEQIEQRGEQTNLRRKVLSTG